MFLLPMQISVQVTLNITGYVSDFIYTMCIKVQDSFCVKWRGCCLGVMSFVICVCRLSVLVYYL
jgi:hypothetical protein